LKNNIKDMQKENTKYQLLTFYKFVDIEDPHKIVEDHLQFTKDIGMRGRIFIGEEGINATVSGNTGQIKAYRLYLDSIPHFQNIPDIDAKACYVDGHQFEKMHVRYRKEIVALGVKYTAKDIERSKHKITVDDFKKVIDNNDDDYVIIDMRNNYEYELGHFKNAIPAGTLTFKDTERLIEHYKNKYDDKKLIMYCTGGIRCEKVSVMLEEKGLPGVYQLDGGIVKYLNKFNDGNWLGNLYTFDNRVSCYVGDNDNHEVISKCHYSGKPAEEMFNCRYGPCNDQIIADPKEYKKHMGFCSEACATQAMDDLYIKKEDFDEMDYKKLRIEVKNNPELKDKNFNIGKEHLQKKLDGVEFNHKKPVERKLIFA
jgi:UPF0176 protein